MGSVLAVGYRTGLGDATDALSPESAEMARDSIGFALAVASDLPTEKAQPLIDAAASAFTDGLALAFFVSAGVLVFTAVVVAVFHPGEPKNEQA